MASAHLYIKHYDYRPPKIRLSGLEVGQADLLHLPFAENSISSLSCLHVLEHIGLGRYGDQIDAEGDRAAARELARVLSPTGKLLIVVPVGRPRVNFNAHRVYAYEEVHELFAGLRVHESVLIPDQSENGWICDPSPALVNAQDWGCGCFIFVKN
jgi:SAM-dependent methyltransferase